MNRYLSVGRRQLLKASAMLSGIAAMPATAGKRLFPSPRNLLATNDASTNVASGSTERVTVERRDAIVMIGINRPEIANRIDPDTYLALARALYQYDLDDSARAALLFGHGESFSQGIDVAGFAPIIAAGRPFLTADEPGTRDPLQKASPKRLSKPLIAVVHGDTWNMAHEIFLNCDVRIAATDTRFGQDECTHGRFPGGGSTVRFVREAGWGNAMRYMLTGDHWGAQDAYRMGLVQQIAPNQYAALQAGLAIAEKIAKCAPLGLRATLASAHLAIVEMETPALSQLDTQFGRLFHTRDFQEGREADAQGRAAVFIGK
jgi:enoyl-CoA hydratase